MDSGSQSPRRYANSPSYAQRAGQNGSRDQVSAPEPLRPMAAVMTRAEKFEDEKRRIMSSCFSKMDSSGVLVQSYITHIRVEEDAMYPSSPPPPEAAPQYKKGRAIIVAVKNTGRVWVHKARENDDNTFQIGKSWPMEDVQAIESFSNPSTSSPEAQNKAKWAGNVGFILTMAKPYYWAAKTPKEKDFFIGSLVKIYRKYTSGNVPQLIGFTAQERDQILGASMPQASSSPRVQTPPESRLGQYNNAASPLQPPRTLGSPSRGTPGTASPSSIHSSIAPPPQPPPLSQDRFASQLQTAKGLGPQLNSYGSQDSGLRQQSRDPYSPSSRSVTPQSSHSNFIEPRSNASGPPNFSQPRLGPSALGPGGSSDNLHMSQGKTEQSRSNGAPAIPSPGGFEPTPPDSFNSENSQAPNVGQRGLPERKRPPLQESEYSRPNAFSDQSDPNVIRPLAPKPSISETSRPSTSERSIQPMSGGSPSPIPAPSTLQRNQSPAVSERPAASTEKLDERSTNFPFSNDISADEAAAAATGPITPVEDQEQYRPGLGPMLAKKSTNATEVANKFRKAATAANAFKPRAGGAGDRLFSAKAKSGNEPDGVTAVVPAPPKQDSALSTPVERRSEELPRPSSKPIDKAPTRVQTPPVVNEVPISTPAEEPRSIYVSKDMSSESLPDARVQAPLKAAERIKKRRSNKYANCYTTLDIDPLIFEGRSSTYDEILTDFGWEGNVLQPRKLEAMEQDIRREINRLEAGSWLGNSESKDDRVEMVASMLDKAIAECDEMEGLLTLYGVELGTLNDDIAYIEAQSQGLQVQTANQKALQTELENLVSTVSITSKQLEPLQSASLGDSRGIESIESCLYSLYKALSTIDPSSFQSHASHVDGDVPTDHALGSMRALQDKKSGYLNQAYTFLERLRNYMDPTFGAAFIKTTDALNRNSTLRRETSNAEAHEAAREHLWQYNPLMLFAKEIDSMSWQRMIEIYQGRAGPVYKDEFRNTFDHWRSHTRKPTGDEAAAVFTGHERESESLTHTARKLTVKRSQTLARGWRSNSLDKKAGGDKDSSSNREPHDAFSCVLRSTVDLIAREQNFVVDFFHATSTETVNFIDVLTAATPANRKRPVGYNFKAPEPDRSMAERMTETTSEIFRSWPSELQNFVDGIVKDDPLQGVGILCALELTRFDQEDTNQDFILRSVQKLHDHLSSLFNKFLDDQIRAIEDTKVKIKKRKGVIGFMRVFPHFSAAIENGFPEDATQKNLEVRSMVDSAYSRINKAMFDSLKAIAKESPMAMPGGMGQSTDPDDKEALNYHILLIENMFHYIEIVDEHGSSVLGEWKELAKREYAEHENLYISAIIRRPLSKLLDFLESTENLVSSAPTRAPTSIPTTHASHSRSVFKKVMSSYDAKEVKKGIYKLRERVEKHLTEDEPTPVGQQLVSQILTQCEKRYTDVFERAQKISKDVYESSVEVEVGKEEISQAFRR